MLEARDISFSYQNSIEVLSSISITIKSGDLIALLGRNGSGKTTLMKLLLGFLKSSNGTVSIDGTNISNLKSSEIAKKLAYIPQISSMTFPSTVEECVVMGRANSIGLFSTPGKKERAEAERAMKSIGIYSLKDRMVNQLSGGERQLVLLSRALCQNAEILLLDEPTSALDYSNQLLVLDALKTLSQEGYGILFSTHNPEQAMMENSSIFILDHKRGELYRNSRELLNGERLSKLYGRELFVRELNTGKNERIICIPK